MIQISSFNQLQPIYRYLRKQRENQKFLNYLEISATFILVCFFLFFAIKPTASIIFSLVGEIKSKDQLVEQMKAKINSIARAQELYSQAQEKYEIIESALPDTPKYYQSALNFNSFSQSSSSPIEKISFNLNEKTTSKKISPDISSYSIYLNGKSDYQSVLNLIQKILKGRRVIDLENISFSKKDDEKDTSSNLIQTQFSTRLFYLNEKK